MKPFDTTLWLADNLELRREYSYRETSGVSCAKPATGVVTHPVCPWCGGRRGPDNHDFKSGYFFCETDCEMQFERKVNSASLHVRMYFADPVAIFDPVI